MTPAIDAIKLELDKHRAIVTALEQALGLLTGGTMTPGKAAAPRPQMTGGADSKVRNGTKKQRALIALHKKDRPVPIKELAAELQLDHIPNFKTVLAGFPRLFLETPAGWMLTEQGKETAQTLTKPANTPD